MSNREEDLRMLHEALALDSLSDETRMAFASMLEDLGVRRELSDNQRSWVKSVLDEPEYQNLASSGRVSTQVSVRRHHQRMSDEHLLSLEEAGAKFRRTPRALRGYIHAGILPASKVGKSYLVSLDDLRALFEPRARAQAHAADTRKAPRVGIVLPGWTCNACGIFNGEEKEQLESCRLCGRPR